MTSSEAATPQASGSPMDLVGKTVRWESRTVSGKWCAVLVDDIDRDSRYVQGKCVHPGTFVHFLRKGETIKMPLGHVTVIDSDPVTEDEECE